MVTEERKKAMTEEQLTPAADQPKPDPGNSDPAEWTQELPAEEVEKAKRRLEEEFKGDES